MPFIVVHFVNSPQAGLQDIPLVLNGEIPTSAAATGGKVGSGNLSLGIPRVVVVGATYDDIWIESLRKEVVAVGKHVLVLKPDLGGGVAPPKPSAEQAKVAAERAVKVLKKLEEEGKLDTEEDTIYLY